MRGEGKGGAWVYSWRKLRLHIENWRIENSHWDGRTFFFNSANQSIDWKQPVILSFGIQFLTIFYLDQPWPTPLTVSIPDAIFRRVLKRGRSGVCALWSVTETGENRRVMNMWLLEEDLATGEELSINALQQTKHRRLRSLLCRHHHAFGLHAYSIIPYPQARLSPHHSIIESFPWFLPQTVTTKHSEPQAKPQSAEPTSCLSWQTPLFPWANLRSHILVRLHQTSSIPAET